MLNTQKMKELQTKLESSSDGYMSKSDKKASTIQIAELKQEIDDLKSKCGLKSETEALKSDNQKLSDENNELIDENKKMTNTKNEMERLNVSSQSEIEHRKSDKKASTTQIAESKQEIDDLNAMNASTSETDTLKQRIDDLESTNDALTDENKRFKLKEAEGFEKFISYWAEQFPIEATIGSYYAVMSSITALIFHGADECGLGDRVLSLLLFFTFASIPIIYESYSAIIRGVNSRKRCCKTILKMVVKTLILKLFFVTIEERPWSCYMDDDIKLLNIAVIGVFIFIYIFIQ